MSTSEEIRYDGQQQDREDTRREMLERRGRMGGPDAPEPCEECEGTGCRNDQCRDNDDCPKCLGSGVQP